MSECMPIPDNWKDFVKEYSFKDIREIYTNGSWLIPTFRVEQMMEHFVKPEWISVKDRLPENDGKYIVWCKSNLDICEFNTDSQTFGYTYDEYDETYSFGYIYDEYGEYDETYSPLVCWDDGINEKVTHWMPLPEPPKESTNE